MNKPSELFCYVEVKNLLNGVSKIFYNVISIYDRNDAKYEEEYYHDNTYSEYLDYIKQLPYSHASVYSISVTGEETLQDEYYYGYGLPNRIDGPAVTNYNGLNFKEYWWIHGIMVDSFEEYFTHNDCITDEEKMLLKLKYDEPTGKKKIF